MTRKPEPENEGVSELLRRVVLASVGAAAIGKDEIEEFVRRAREQGDISSADAQNLKEKLSEAFKRMPGGWDEIIDGTLRSTLRRLNLPDRDEIERLQRVVDRLTKKIEEMNK